MSYPDLEGRVAVITGGSGGIGAAAARRFLAEGMRVVLVDQSGDQLAAVAGSLPEPTDRLVTVAADVTEERDVERYVARALDAFGTIDAFFNNAGVVGSMKPIIELTETEFRRAINVNLVGAFLGLRHVLPVMYANRRGAIVNTSSIAGLESTLGTASYDSSKHGLTGLSKVAALESAPYGIRVNSIHPGPVQTGMMAEIQRQRNPGDPVADGGRMAAAIPLGRVGTPMDIVNLATYLLSDQAGYITGASYRIDGGMGAAARLAVVPARVVGIEEDPDPTV